MGIDSESKLFVGTHFAYIKASRESLSELEDDGYLVRVSPYYDAPDKECFFGVEVTTAEIMAEGGIERIRRLIGELNELFQTTGCDLIHSPHIW
jgi:hypothetical protein